MTGSTAVPPLESKVTVAVVFGAEEIDDAEESLLLSDADEVPPDNYMMLASSIPMDRR